MDKNPCKEITLPSKWVEAMRSAAQEITASYVEIGRVIKLPIGMPGWMIEECGPLPLDPLPEDLIENMRSAIQEITACHEGIGKTIGDESCSNNAKSKFLRCAINPCGPCEGCKYYQSIVS